MNIESQFQHAMHASGIKSDAQVVADGKLCRFHIDGDRPGTKNGWAVLHPGTHPAGAFGSNKTGASGKWRAAGASAPITNSARAAMDAQRAAHQQAAEARQQQTATTAARFVTPLPTANPAFPYLVKKGVRPHGILQSGDLLVIPIRDISGTITSLQTITSEGEKRFLFGGKITGGFFVIGEPLTSHSTHAIVTEGFATGATLRECGGAVGSTVVVAFNAGNLLSVAKAIRAAFPAIEMAIAADWDGAPAGGIGVEKATQAADSVCAELWVPLIPDGMNADKADFNDIAVWQQQQQRRVA